MKRVALVNGKIFTGVDGQGEAQALLYEDGKICEVGSDSRILEMIGGRESQSALVVDLGGRTAIPGLSIPTTMSCLPRRSLRA